jgi:hypothetical protein
VEEGASTEQRAPEDLAEEDHFPPDRGAKLLKLEVSTFWDFKFLEVAKSHLVIASRELYFSVTLQWSTFGRKGGKITSDAYFIIFHAINSSGIYSFVLFFALRDSSYFYY